MANVNPGYMGWAELGAGGTKIRFSDCNIAAKQDINAPDLITGNFNRMAYNYGKVEITGSISGPVTENFAAVGSGIWDWSATRDACGLLSPKDVAIHYFCNSGGGVNTDAAFTGMLANSVTFSCAAGDVAQYSVDTMAATVGAFSVGASGDSGEAAEKLLTWDQVNLTVSGTGPGAAAMTSSYFSNFDFTLANNCTPVYRLGQDNLLPFEIVTGLRSISGSISVYNIPGAEGVLHYSDYDAGTTGTIAFDIGPGITITVNVQFHRIEPKSDVGPIISTVAFTGVGSQPPPLN